jgi:hypothetical protein
MGVAISALFQSLMTGVAPRDSGAASGALQAFQNVGGALGIAITGQMFFSTLGETPSTDAFAAAAANATWYQIIMFALVAVANLLVFLRPRPPKSA